MRVIHVIDSFGAGGAERSLAEMLPRLDPLGVQSRVVCLRRRTTSLEKEVEIAGVPVTFLTGTHQSQLLISLRREISRQRPELIHTALFASTMLGRVAALRSGIPLLTSLVSTPYAPCRIPADPNLRVTSFRAVQLADLATTRLTSHFHAITEAVRDAAMRDLRIPRKRITVVSRGRDPVRLGERTPQRRATARSMLGIDDDQVLVLAVGRQEFQKGHLHLLRAVPGLLQRKGRIVVAMAGRPGAATPLLEKIRLDLGLGDHVRFLGHRDDVPDLLCAADVFAFPSLLEGFGGAVLEAMALRVPIVASDVPALREVLAGGSAGRLVPPGDSSALARALEEVLDAPFLTAARVEAAGDLFRKKYSIEKVVEEMADLYQRVVASGR